MSGQIIKKTISNDLLFNFLEKCSAKIDTYYKIDINTYKKAVYLDILQIFVDDLIPYYYKSKQFYLTRKMSFNYLTTIIRQICKKNNIMFTSKIKYIGSTYNIIYYVYV